MFWSPAPCVKIFLLHVPFLLRLFGPNVLPTRRFDTKSSQRVMSLVYPFIPGSDSRHTNLTLQIHELLPKFTLQLVCSSDCFGLNPCILYLVYIYMYTHIYIFGGRCIVECLLAAQNGGMATGVSGIQGPSRDHVWVTNIMSHGTPQAVENTSRRSVHSLCIIPIFRWEVTRPESMKYPFRLQIKHGRGDSGERCCAKPQIRLRATWPTTGHGTSNFTTSMSLLIHFWGEGEGRKRNIFAMIKRVSHNYLNVLVYNALEGAFHNAYCTGSEEEVGRELCVQAFRS